MRRTTFTKIRQRLANASAATMFLAAQITAVVMVFMPARTMALDTGVQIPTAATAPNNWDVSTVANIQTSNDQYVSEDDGSQQGYRFNLPAITAGSVINGIRVTTEAKSTDDNGCRLGISLSWNGSANETGTEYHSLTDSDTTSVAGGATDTWGRTWSAADFTSSNFVVILQDNDPAFGGCNNEATTSVDLLQVQVFYTEPVVPVANVGLTQACGLDIALVMDNSNSISSSELTSMKNALKGFTNSLSGTPTQFSVTRFGSNASVISNFTSDVTTTNAAIDGVNTGGGGTNWEDGLLKAQSTFDPRTSKPNLIIFASDGNPTYHIGGGNGSSTSQADLDAAITQANVNKAAGSRILALGIGNDLSVSNLQQISGNTINAANLLDSDVITTDFSTMAIKLTAFAQQTCGGTITVNKLIDLDGQPGGATTPGEDWTFTVGGQSGKKTNAEGQTEAVTLTAGSNYSVTETQQTGYTLLSASCSGAAANGTPSGNGISGITINDTDIVSCTFINARTKGTIELKKVWSGGTGQTTLAIGTSSGGNQIASQQTGASGATPLTTGKKDVVTGTYYVSETALTGFTGSLACYNDANDNGTQNTGESTVSATQGAVAVGENQHIICTYTNSRDLGSVTVTKLVDNDGNGTFEVTNPAAFNWTLDSGSANTMGSTVNNVPTGSHTVQENSLANYHFVGWYPSSSTQYSCANPYSTTIPANITVNKDTTTAITLCNARDTGSLRVLKNVDLNGDGDYTDPSETGNTTWQWNANNGNNHSTGDAAIVVETGNYTLAESGPSDYHFVSLSCPGATLNGKTVTVAKDQAVTCTFTNARDSGTIQFLKQVIGGTSAASDWTFTIAGNGTAKSGDQKTYLTGVYQVSESGPSGYSATGASGVCALDMQGVIWLTVSTQGGLCTITNTRDTGSVTVNKLLDDDGDGTFETVNPTTFGWKLDESNTTNAMGSTLNTVETGSHGVTETSPSGYHFVGWYRSGDTQHSCSNPEGTTLPVNVTVSKNTTTAITLCNARDTATVTVTKSLLPTNDSGKFNLLVNGIAKATNVGNNGTTGTVTVPTDTVTISETAGNGTNLDSYVSSYVCMNGNNKVAEGNGTTISSLSAAKDAHIACTFTNTRKGKIVVEKQTNPNGNQTNFTFSADFAPDFTLKDDQQQSFIVTPGSYSVTEQSNSSWQLTSAVCSDQSSITAISVQPGETVTCVFTNTLRTGTITGTKLAVDASGQNGKPLKDWKFFIDKDNDGVRDGNETQVSSNNSGIFNFTNLLPGDYRVCEVVSSDWIKLLPQTNDNCTTLSVLADQTTNVTFGNFKKGTISGYKFHDLNANGYRDGIGLLAEPKIANWTIYLYKDGSVTPTQTTHTSSSLLNYGNYEFSGLAPGQYTICEAHEIGWQQVVPNPTDQNGCYHFTISRSGQEETAIFGNQAVGTIKVTKNVDTSGDNAPEITNSSDWEWNYYGLAASQSDIPTGSDPVIVPAGLAGNFYLITEDQKSGYDLTGVDCNVQFWRIGDAVKVFVTKGTNVECTLTNTKRASLTVTKQAQPADGTDFKFSLRKADSRNDSHFKLDDEGEDSSDDNVPSSKTFSLEAGYYYISEEHLPAGWNLSDISCTGADYYTWGHTLFIQVETGATINCTFLNKKDNTIVVHKYNDLNRNGQFDEGEAVLAGWDFTLGNGSCGEDMKIDILSRDQVTKESEDSCGSSQIQTTNEFGDATFESINPDGSYTLNETIPEDSNWHLGSIDCGEEVGSLDGDTYYFNGARMGAGRTIDCYVGNYRTAALQITKSNNQPVPTRIGKIVTYTLTVTVPEDSGTVFFTLVADLPPKGFNYIPGSWTATSNMPLASVAEPTYGSPGVWRLGTLLPGQIVTLTYKTLILDSVNNGTYPDIAFAAGCDVPVNEGGCDGKIVLANISTGLATPFVGTNVTLVSDPVTTSTTEVTQLVNTGSAYAWLSILASVSLVGLAIVTVTYRQQKGGK